VPQGLGAWGQARHMQDVTACRQGLSAADSALHACARALTRPVAICVILAASVSMGLASVVQVQVVAQLVEVSLRLLRKASRQ
jgi:hypothetical protein